MYLISFCFIFIFLCLTVDGNESQGIANEAFQEYFEDITNLGHDTLEYEGDNVGVRKDSKNEIPNQQPLYMNNLEERKSRNLTLETFLILDYGVYKKFLLLSHNNARKAEEDIIFYFSHVMHRVDQMYLNMHNPNYNFTVKVTGIRIQKQAKDSLYTETSLATHEVYLISAFDKLKRIVKKNQTNIPETDLIIIFTGYPSYSINGLAIMSSVCRSGLVFVGTGGILRDSYITAHEIGHSLGSKHDGDDNTCLQARYMMNPVLGYKDMKNEHQLSSCSIKYIDAYVKELTDSDNNCMREKNHSLEDYMDLSEAFSALPGGRWDLDQQCLLIYGPGSYYCSEGAKSQFDICEKIQCFSPYHDSCVTSGTSKAYDGTPCGDHKWCLDRKCVTDVEAPEGKEYCMFGDAKMFFELASINGTVLTCGEGGQKWFAQTIRGVTEDMCEDEEVKDKCCEKCKNYINNNLSD